MGFPTRPDIVRSAAGMATWAIGWLGEALGTSPGRKAL